MEPQSNELDLVIDIWENGHFLETSSIEDKDISLYKYKKNLILIWYDGNTVIKTEKITYETAMKYFPELILLRDK